MSADWYTKTGAPADNSQGSSATMRAEFALIETALDKLPTLTGNGSEVVRVNSAGTALESVSSIGVAQGGTGATSLTDGGILLGSGTSAVTVTARPTTGEVLVGASSGDPTLQSGATLRTSLGLGTTDAVAFASLTLTTALAVAQGGTGVTSLTDGGILLGSGAGGVTVTAQGADGEVLVGTGAGDPVWESGATLRTSIGLGTGNSPTFAGLTLSSPLAVAQGGTGATSYTAGHVLVGNGTGAIAAVNMVTKGNILVGDGSGAPTALAVGTDTHVLTADSGEATGVKWAAVGGVGGVGTLTTVKANGVQVGGADIATLDFSSQFTVTESPDTEINISLSAASESTAGLIELATQGEVNAGDTTRAVTGATLAAWPGGTNTVTVGTLTSGTWNASTIGVAYGGTGQTTLTDGGHLLGNGTSAIEVTARPTLGQVLVGQSTGSPVLQSGATLLSTLGITNNATHTGDVTGATALTIANNVVSNAKMTTVATNTIKGRVTSGTGNVEDLTGAQVRSIINVEDGATADMTASEIRTALLTVDGSGSGIDADLLDGIQAASFIQVGSITTSGLTINTARLAGRTTASSGALEEITVGRGLSLASTALTWTAPVGRIYRSTTQAVGVGTTRIGFNATDFSALSRGTFDVATNNRYTTDATGGRVRITAAVYVANVPSGDTASLLIRLNGSTVVGRDFDRNDSGSGQPRRLQATAIVTLAASEYIDCAVTLSSGDDLTLGVSYTYMEVEELS